MRRIDNDVMGCVLSFASTRRVPYIPALNAFTGGVDASILCVQLDYWFARKRDGFYKFLTPCSNSAYRPGDSWFEELGMSKHVFNRAFDSMGYRYVSRKAIAEQCRKIFISMNEVDQAIVSTALQIALTLKKPCDFSNETVWGNLEVDDYLAIIKTCQSLAAMAEHHTHPIIIFTSRVFNERFFLSIHDKNLGRTHYCRHHQHLNKALQTMLVNHAQYEGEKGLEASSSSQVKKAPCTDQDLSPAQVKDLNLPSYKETIDYNNKLKQKNKAAAIEQGGGKPDIQPPHTSKIAAATFSSNSNTADNAPSTLAENSAPEATKKLSRTSPSEPSITPIISDALTPDQTGVVVKRFTDPLLADVRAIDPSITMEQAVNDVTEYLLSPTTFKQCGRDFNWKLNAIVEKIMERRWTPLRVQRQGNAAAAATSEAVQIENDTLRKLDERIRQLKRDIHGDDQKLPEFKATLSDNPEGYALIVRSVNAKRQTLATLEAERAALGDTTPTSKE